MIQSLSRCRGHFMGLEKSKGRCVVNAQRTKRRPGSGEWVEHATQARSESKMKCEGESH